MASRQGRSALNAIVSTAAFGLVAACSNPERLASRQAAGGASVRSERLAVESDTLMISTAQSVNIPVHAVGRDGRLVSGVRLIFSSNSSVLRTWPDGRIACTRSGDAVVTIAAHAITTRIVALCRRRMWLTLSVAGASDTLWVGGPPREISVVAYDSANHPVHLPSGTATARIYDDSIARIVGGRVYALSRGRTRVDLAFGGLSGLAGIDVVERAIHDSLRLVGGELRTWRVSPGYYEPRLDVPATREQSQALVLGVYNGKCYSVPRDDGRHAFCHLADDSSIIVRNTAPVASGSELFGELTVLRLP